MKKTTTKGPFDYEWARLCPFCKEKIITYDTIGPNYTPVPVMESETFKLCIGEECMMYMYDAASNVESCLLARKPYEV